LWQPRAWRASIIWARRAGVTRSPRTCQEMSWFWQNTQRRLQPEKKIAPEPFQPPQAVLLPEMRKGGGDHGLAADGAQPLVVGQAVHLAQARADPTALLPKQGQGMSGPRRQLVGAQPQIRRQLIPGGTHRNRPLDPHPRVSHYLSWRNSASQKAGRSPGWREVMMMPPASETASTSSWSTQSAPAFRRSVLIEW
jgi:hypothetical protein